jgi:hypothetical protein
MYTVEQQVEHLFANADDRHEEFRRNPVTGGGFVRGLDLIRPQKQLAVKALEARAWFEAQRPSDAAELPLSNEEREFIKAGGVNYIVSVFGRSLEAGDYKMEEHARFEEYARGVMASPLTPEHVRNDPDLLRRYPPTSLPGLRGGLIWSRLQ